MSVCQVRKVHFVLNELKLKYDGQNKFIHSENRIIVVQCLSNTVICLYAVLCVKYSISDRILHQQII